MNVSSISSSQNAYQPDVQSPWKKRAQDFKALQSALQSGDLSGAQTAFAAFQKDQPTTAQAAQASSPSSQNAQATQGAKDFQALQTALSSGDMSGAQQAFASLKQDLQASGQARRHHHHKNNSADSTTQTAQAGSTSAQATTTSAQATQGAKDFQALQSALSTGDLSGAQQAFAALKQDLQGTGKTGHHHHHHGGGSVNSTTPTASTTSSATAAQSVSNALDVQA